MFRKTVHREVQSLSILERLVPLRDVFIVSAQPVTETAEAEFSSVLNR